MKKASRLLKNQNGLAMLETVPLLVIFAMLMGFSLGFYGIIQTAILHSIAARTYAFATFRDRTNLTYYREDGSGLLPPYFNYTPKGWRFHAVESESDTRAFFVPSTRDVSMGWTTPETQTSQDVHNQSIFSLLPRNTTIGVNPAWIMVGYGICLNAQCGN